MTSREQIKAETPERHAVQRDRKRRRVQALVHAIRLAQTVGIIDREPLRDMLIAEHESFEYHRRRADGYPHDRALEFSRAERREIDWMIDDERPAG